LTNVKNVFSFVFRKGGTVGQFFSLQILIRLMRIALKKEEVNINNTAFNDVKTENIDAF